MKPAARGCLYRHTKTGGWYWKIKKPGEDKYSYLPMVPAGKSVATKSKGIAENIRRKLFELWFPGTVDAPRPMAKWLADFRAWNANTASDGQVVFNARVVGQFLKHQGIDRLWEILPEHVERYLAGLRKNKRAERTILHHRNALSKFCRFLTIRQVLDRNPATLVEVRTPAQRPPRFLTDKQVRALLKKTGSGWLHDAVSLAVYQGLRRGELGQLRAQDINTDTIMVGGAHPTKTGGYRIIPIFPEAHEVLTSLRKAKGFLFPQKPSWWWVDQLRRVTKDLPVFGELPGPATGNQWHLLRSTFAVSKARAGATVWELMSWLGHKNPATTMRYVNIAQAAG